ncbi:MAG TPA: PilN domain-containing protein [Pyrinomonadaceae bacterium]
MIKVNLLDSVTDRAKGVAAVEEKVANPRTQTMLLALVVFGILTAGMLYDYYSSSNALDDQQKQKAEQEQVQAQMVAVNQERLDLEKKTAAVQSRIDAIQALRTSQQGPGAVLREIKLRFDSIPGLYFKNVKQSGQELVITGVSPNEASVTNFAKSLEFSSGLFTNVSIETQREELKPDASDKNAQEVAEDPDAPKPEVVSFTVKCTYGAAAPAQPSAAPGKAVPASQVAQK